MFPASWHRLSTHYQTCGPPSPGGMPSGDVKRWRAGKNCRSANGSTWNTKYTRGTAGRDGSEISPSSAALTIRWTARHPKQRGNTGFPESEGDICSPRATDDACRPGQLRNSSCNLVVAIGLPPDGEAEGTQRRVDDVEGFTQTINVPPLAKLAGTSSRWGWVSSDQTGGMRIKACGAVAWRQTGVSMEQTACFFPNRQRLLLLLVGQPSIGIPPSDPNAFRADRNGTQQAAAGVIPHPTSCHQEPALPTWSSCDELECMADFRDVMEERHVSKKVKQPCRPVCICGNSSYLLCFVLPLISPGISRMKRGVFGRPFLGLVEHDKAGGDDERADRQDWKG